MRKGRTAVLLDLDGTLADNYEGIARSIIHALVALDVEPPPPHELRECVGPPLRQSFARLLATDDPAHIERALLLYRERYRDVGWAENLLYPGVPAALLALRSEGHRLVLCTSKPQPFAERITAHFGIAGHLDALYGADLAGRLDDKRDLMGVLLRTERLDASGCVMVGDREHDMRAARAHGAAALGVLWGYGSRRELEQAGADAIVAATAELAEAALDLMTRARHR